MFFVFFAKRCSASERNRNAESGKKEQFLKTALRKDVEAKQVAAEYGATTKDGVEKRLMKWTELLPKDDPTPEDRRMSTFLDQIVLVRKRGPKDGCWVGWDAFKGDFGVLILSIVLFGPFRQETEYLGISWC
ncbi:hypothetical protein L596_018275 [Steinernema carpocapsae]|uniref:Uncharacterized protein n=1 Tax=Steinernema carpocapsae TaxID=34508 RepID=A0A4U5N4V7_STECR|nr:hypothetical protein L596_018275 [Steinernema carpocapsae]